MSKFLHFLESCFLTPYLFLNKERNPKTKTDVYNFNVFVIQIRWIPIPCYHSLGAFVWKPKALKKFKRGITR